MTTIAMLLAFAGMMLIEQGVKVHQHWIAVAGALVMLLAGWYAGRSHEGGG